MKAPRSGRPEVSKGERGCHWGSIPQPERRGGFHLKACGNDGVVAGRNPGSLFVAWHLKSTVLAIAIFPLRVIVPFSDWKDRYEIASWMVRVEPTAENGPDKRSAADVFPWRTVSRERFVRKLGGLSNSIRKEVAGASRIVLYTAQ